MIVNKRNITLEIETLKCGQPRRYADSEYEFVLTVDGMNEKEVKLYCTSVLHRNRQTKEEWLAGKSSSEGSYFLGYYTFERIGDNKYRYYVCEPYCD